MPWLPQNFRRFLLLHDLPNWLKKRIATFDDGWWEATESDSAKAELSQRYSAIRKWLYGLLKVVLGIVIGGIILQYFTKHPLF
jgi:hypothetical protein